MSAATLVGWRRAAWFIATAFIAVVWGVNGLWCKVLGGVVRHEAIVARVVGAQAAGPLTVVIGFAELGMLAWFLSGYRVRLCAAAQVGIVMTMNAIELLIASDLLLFGVLNFFFAALFCVVVVVRTRLHTKGAA